MDSLFGVPMDRLAIGGVVANLLVLSTLALLARRRPLLARLALRSPGRRPGQSVLICLGLTLSTIIISTALSTGDAMTHTVHSLVASGLGRADEVVLAVPTERRRSPAEYVGALLNGSLLTGLGSFFDEEHALRLTMLAERDSRIAGLTPAIGDLATVVNLDAQLVRGQVSVLALPPSYPAVFGALTSLDGVEQPLRVLEVGEIFVNTEAASALDARAGARLELEVRGRRVPARVRDVVHGGEFGGAQPRIYFPLEAYQHAIGQPGRINQILVANQGSATTSVRRSEEVSRELRAELADPEIVHALFALLRSDAGRTQVAAALRGLDGRPRVKLEKLLATLDEAEPSRTFVGLATDPDVERRLLSALRPLGASGGASANAFRGQPQLRVVEIKQATQDQAERWGGAITTSFFVLGLFSLATGALLVFLIFSMLAAERRRELGIARALGARRRDIVVLFVLEGALYNLVGSALGLAIGVLVAVAIVALADAALRDFGLRLSPSIETRSLVVAFCFGLLLTVATVTAAAWHIGKLSMVNAIRNLPEPRRVQWRWVVVRLLCLACGPAFAWFGATSGIALPRALGVLITVVGLAQALVLLLTMTRVSPELRERWAYSLAGIVLLAYWLAPAQWPLVSALRPSVRAIEVFFLTGLCLVLGAVWVLVYNLQLLTRPLIAATARFRSAGLALRTAVANPLQHRLRSGLTIAMFALVTFSMVVAGVLLTATHRAYGDPDVLSGGFTIRMELARAADPVDIEALLTQGAAVRRDQFEQVGRLTSHPAQTVRPGPGARRWESTALLTLDAGFVDGLRAPLAARSPEFASDADAWRAVSSQPGLAIASAQSVDSRGFGSTMDSGSQAESLLDNGRFAPWSVWIRDSRGGAPVKLTIIGVLDSRVALGQGIFAGPTSLASARALPPERTLFYFRSAEGADASTLAQGLNLSFESSGLRAVALGEELRRIQTVRNLLNELLQGFIGVGLLAGLASLGLISLRAVVERRHQIGLLRALGFRRGMVRLSMLLESSLIAVLGIGLGVVLGLALSRDVVAYVSREYPEIVFRVPWEQIGLVSLGGYLCALILVALPLWQIGRIQPAEALRYD